MYQENQNLAKRPQVWMPLLLALALVLGMLIGTRLQPVAPTVVLEAKKEDSGKNLGQGKIEELLRYIDAKYVDEVDREELIQKAINEILEDLDPHSNYISAEQLREVNEQLEGNFDGIGVEFMILDDTIVVIAPLAGGPSEAVGIMAGDKIVEIEDSVIAGVNITTKDVMSLLRGEKGSQVSIGVLRNPGEDLIDFTITRDEIPNHSVDIAYMVDDKTGYIKINRFSATTYEEFMKGLEKLVEQKQMEDLIIDLRHNPGGYLQEATKILSELFKDKDKLLVYTEGRTVNRSDYESKGRAYYKVDDIAILIDEGSASASEILAGAIQDHDRGIVLGRRSFGKGLVQEQYKLRDGSALRLTVARYYTPSGRSIQKSFENREAYDDDLMERYNSGELSDEEKVAIFDSTKYYTSQGRVVYGGGGISPDLFVPLDTILMNEAYLEMRQHVPQFIYRYLDKNEAKLDYTLENFVDNFSISQATIQDFLAYLKEKEVDNTDGRLNASMNEIKRFMKARIAKHLYSDEGFYAVWNKDDEMIRKAQEALKSSTPISGINK